MLVDVSQPGQPIVFVNEGWEHITGYSIKDVVGMNCGALLQVRGKEPHCTIPNRTVPYCTVLFCTAKEYSALHVVHCVEHNTLCCMDSNVLDSIHCTVYAAEHMTLS